MKKFNMPIPAQMFVRDQGDGKSMLLCLIPTECIPENLHRGAFLRGDIILCPKKVFDASDLYGWLAEDILTHSHDLSEMDQISLTD